MKKLRILIPIIASVIFITLCARFVFAIDFEAYQDKTSDQITKAVLSDPSSEYYKQNYTQDDYNNAKADIEKKRADYYAKKAQEQQQQQQKEQEKPPQMPEIPKGGGSDDKKGGEQGKGQGQGGGQQPGGQQSAKPEEGGKIDEKEGPKTCQCEKVQGNEGEKCNNISPKYIAKMTPIQGGDSRQLIGGPTVLGQCSPGKKYTKNKAQLPASKYVNKYLAKKCTKPHMKKGKIVWTVEEPKKIEPTAVDPMSKVDCSG